MSRTTLTLVTASALALLSLGLMATRHHLLGEEVKLPRMPGTWKIILLIQGKVTASDARLTTDAPLDFGHQHLLQESFRSNELFARPIDDARHPEHRHIFWTERPGAVGKPFRAKYDCYCAVDAPHPSASMSRKARELYVAPAAGEYLQPEDAIESDQPEISDLARNLTSGRERPRDQVEALYRYVDSEILNEPTLEGPGLSALACLRDGSGASAGKSRLLTALCRSRGVPTRIVVGLALRHGHEQSPHYWVEAWVDDHWMPLCPCYHHFGKVPATYLVFRFGDGTLVRGKNLGELTSAFLVERVATNENAATAEQSTMRRVLLRLSLFSLPPAEQRLVEFLLLLPIAALIVCFYRNVIGLSSFGTFAPALVGLAFRDLGSLPGILVFVSLVLIGWLLRRALDHYRLLQVPRIAFLLSMVVIVLIGSIVLANDQDLPATKYISLFPMVILTGMIERFWTLEAEDGTASSFRTLLHTLLIAATISLVLSLHAVVRHMFRYPETLGLVMAVQLLLGRYTGYRLSELLRFRDFLNDEPAMSQS